MRTVLAYAFQEARGSLVRGGRGALMSIGTIAIAFVALGGFLLITANLQRLVQQWMDAAELSVYLRDDASEDELRTIQAHLAQNAAVLRVDFVPREAALARFRSDFPELADAADTLGVNPFPASLEVRLSPDGGIPDRAADLAETVMGLNGVADVQFDRRWLERVLSLIAGIRAAGLVVTVVLLLGAAFTVAAVVRLSLHARREELAIMELVGAPLAFIRGPFVMEGVLLGGVGALFAVLILAAAFRSLRGWLGEDAVWLLEGASPEFLPLAAILLLTAAGLAVGGAAGLVASRSAR